MKEWELGAEMAELEIDQSNLPRVREGKSTLPYTEKHHPSLDRATSAWEVVSKLRNQTGIKLYTKSYEDCFIRYSLLLQSLTPVLLS